MPAPGFAELVRWFFRLRVRFRVRGDSMRPLIADGDEVLVDTSAYRHSTPCTDDIVVTRHPYQRDETIIKRVAAVDENGALQLIGLNPDESTDSRTFGSVSPDKLVGRVTSRFQ